MAKFCSGCGTPLDDAAAFCTNCGAAQPAPITQFESAPEPAPVTAPEPAAETQPDPSAQFDSAPKPAPAPAVQFDPATQFDSAPAPQPAPAPKFDPATQFDSPPQPYVQQAQAYRQPAAPTAPRAKGNAGKVIVSIICLVLAAAILISCFIKPGFLVNGSSKGGGSIFNLKGGKTVTVSAENLIAETDSGVTVELSPFLFDYDEELEVSVKNAGVETTEDGKCRITSYDIEIGDLSELGTYIDIRMPYDGSMCDAGEDPAECVGAKYYNESTGEWEDVLYDVDAENKEVVIHTDHLSRYGCFEVSSAGYRKALITSIADYATDYYVDLDTAKKALTEYSKGGGAGEACQQIGLDVLKDVCDGTLAFTGTVGDQLDLVSNTYSGLNLGDIQFFTDRNNQINKTIGDTLGNLGKILGAVKLGAEIAKPGKTDEDVLSIYKDAGMYALSFAEGGLGYAMVGVWMIDKSLTEFGNAAKNIRMENWETIYEYYNDKWDRGPDRARTSAEWRDLIAKVIKASHGDQATFNSLLESQVDAYARRFFQNEPETAIEEIQHIVDHQWRGALSAGEKEQLIEKYKAKLYERLSGAIMKELQNDYEAQLKSQFLKELNNLKDILNSVSDVHIYEELEGENAEPQYAGYKLRFGKLNKDANVPSWTGKFGKTCDITTQISLIGWIAAGQPDHIDFWKPDQDPDTDKPEFTVDFNIDFPKTEVPIKNFVPTFEEVLGYYENGILTIVDVQIPPEFKEAMEAAKAEGSQSEEGEEGCDFNLDLDLEGLIGETKEAPFSLVETGEMTAALGGDSFDEIMSGQGGMVYNDKTGKFSETSFTIEDDESSYQFTMSMECSYSDEQKSGVIAGGHMRLTMVSGFIPGLVIDMDIAGEKPLS